MHVYFISDVHLGLGPRDQEREKESRLLEFLRAIRPDAAALYILGDLFDFWFEYRTVIPRGYHRTLAALQEFTDAGVPVHFLVGNHDCWLDDFLSGEIGVQVYRKPFEALIKGKRVFMHHGDGLAENDLGYKIIKPILRNRVSFHLYRLLHPDLGVRLARGSSRTSRNYTSTKHYGEGEGMLRYARSLIASGVNIVIMGHRHAPSREELDGGVYVNLGDWVHHQTYAVLDDAGIHLRTWNRTENPST
jgi:UDP-2,3-diacylglucosamine hydrolase